MKTIIFDFDGTIADTLPFMHKRMLKLIKEMKVTDLSDNIIVEKIRSKSYPELMKEFNISWLKLPFILNKVYQAQMDFYDEIAKTQLFPGIRETLEELRKRGFRLGILSSNMKENIDKFIKVKKLELFDFIYCEKNIFGKDKAMNHLLKEQNLNKDDVIYIGDEVRDIEACKKAGVKIISVTWGFNNKKNLRRYHPDYLVDESEEILLIVSS